MENFKLGDHSKIGTGFKVPEHYFENFTERLMLEIQRSPKVVSLKPKRRYHWLSVAAVLLMALSIPALDQVIFPKTTQADNTTIENYLTYQSGLSSDDIAAAMSSEDIENIRIDYASGNEIEAALSQNTDIQNYLD